MNTLSPGLRARELDFSFYVRSLSTSTCGMMGVTERGLIGVPTLCTSWEQFVAKFGSYVAGNYAAYAARAFYDEGGNVLWFTRIATNALASSITLKDRSAENEHDTLTVSFVEKGTYGNSRFTVEVADTAGVNPTTFILKFRENGTLVETYTGLTMANIEAAINGVSTRFVVDALTNVSVEKRPIVGTYTLTGGTNGDTGLTSTDFIGDAATKTGLHAFDTVTPLNMLCAPGITFGDFIIAGLAYCEARKYTFFVADPPKGLAVADVADFRNGAGDYTAHAAFNSSYGALYYPWQQITDPLTNASIVIPPSGFITGIFAYSDKKNGHVWDAPAGIQRGRVKTATGVETALLESDMDVLYPEGINCIAKFAGDGVVVWGQKTLQSLSSATDRINVRRLLQFLEAAIVGSGKFVVFEANNPQTWRSLERTVVPFLRGVQNDGGLYEFAFQCDEETNTAEVMDRNELIARVFLKPTKTAEFAEVQFILTQTGASFKEIL